MTFTDPSGLKQIKDAGFVADTEMDLEGQSTSNRNSARDSRDMESMANIINENDRYREVADKHLGEDYVSGINDCDIWVEKRASEAGKDIIVEWGPASTSTVKDHMNALGGKIKSEPEPGANIFFQGDTHTGIILVNPDSSVEVYHQGYNGPTQYNSGKKNYSSVSKFEESWSGTKSYWPQE